MTRCTATALLEDLNIHDVASAGQRLQLAVMLDWIEVLEDYSRRRRLSARAAKNLARELAWIDAEGPFSLQEILESFDIDRRRALNSPRLSKLLQRCRALLRTSPKPATNTRRYRIAWPLTHTQRERAQQHVELHFKPRGWQHAQSPGELALAVWDGCVEASLAEAAAEQGISRSLAYRLVNHLRTGLRRNPPSDNNHAGLS